MKFNEWLQEEHPDFVLDEGWRDWGKKAVIGAALAGSALGMTGCSGGTCDVPKPPIVQGQYRNGVEADATYQQLYQQEYKRQFKIWKNPGKANEMAHQKTQMKIKQMKLQKHAPIHSKASPGHYDAEWGGTFNQGELE
jgi:hypothetical protein